MTVSPIAVELAASPVPATLDHNDLHPWNLLCPEGDPLRARPHDWGTRSSLFPSPASWVVLDWLTSPDGGGLAPDAPELLRIREAYLAEFADLGPRPNLVRALEVARVSATLGRAVSWINVLRAAGEDSTGELAAAPLHWLARLLPGR